MERVADIIHQAGFGFLASCTADGPRVRPMAFVLQPDGALWSSTYNSSGKFRELSDRPEVEVAFVGEGSMQLRITGRVDLTGGADKKAALLQQNPRVGKHFSGPEDPNFVHVEVIPERIRIKPPGFGEYIEVPLPA